MTPNVRRSSRATTERAHIGVVRGCSASGWPGAGGPLGVSRRHAKSPRGGQPSTRWSSPPQWCQKEVATAGCHGSQRGDSSVVPVAAAVVRPERPARLLPGRDEPCASGGPHRRTESVVAAPNQAPCLAAVDSRVDSSVAVGPAVPCVDPFGRPAFPFGTAPMDTGTTTASTSTGSASRMVMPSTWALPITGGLRGGHKTQTGRPTPERTSVRP